MPAIVFLNGQFVAPEEAKVSLFDHGYLFGDGIFETLRAYDDQIFRLGKHVDRLFQSAQYFRIQIPTPKEGLRNLCNEALEKSRLQNAYLRITVSRGVGGRGIDPEACKSPTISIIVKDVPLYSPDFYQSGIATKIVSVSKTNEDALSSRVKGCNYQNNILAKIELNQESLIEGILLNARGAVAEGTVSNVFLVKSGKLLTPSLSCGCLDGITRNAVIEIARSRFGITVEEGELSRYDLYTAEECFFTNTIMEVMPVHSIDGRQIGTVAPGDLTRRLTIGLRELITQEGKK
jgi:branched-chain amino acid aminotransferase